MNDHHPTAGRPPSPRVWMHAALLTAAGLGSTCLAIAGVAGLTVAEGFWARRRLLASQTAASPGAVGFFGTEYEGTPLRLTMMGDSLAVGHGSGDPAQTIGVALATGLAEAARRPVRLDNVAQVGAESTGLLVQLAVVRTFSPPPDVALIIVGANDVMHLRPLAATLPPLRTTIKALRRMRARVVVASCPDLGTVRSFFEPLRLFAHWLSRLLATSQTIVALRAGARTVSLADGLGPLFRRDPGSMFSSLDHLHPSGLGYVRTAEVLMPSVRAAAGYPVRGERVVPYRVYDKGSRHRLAWLAFRASRRAGTTLQHVGDVATASPPP